MSIREDQVRRVATLARLRLSDEETRALTEDLGRILDYVDKLAQLDTDSVEPTSHLMAAQTSRAEALDTSRVAAAQAPYREDRLLPRNGPDAADDAVANAPRRSNHFFVVPPIIE